VRAEEFSLQHVRMPGLGMEDDVNALYCNANVDASTLRSKQCQHITFHLN
jgi:hypothetical protein